jgi:hypothetical protein
MSAFFIDIIFRSHYGPGVDSASNRNEYQGYLVGCKGGRCVGLTTLPPSCADCLEILGASTSWSPKVLSRHCTGIATYVSVRAVRTGGSENSWCCRVTSARQVPTEEPDEVCPTTIGQKGLLKWATPTVLGLGANHPHTWKNNIDSETKKRWPDGS